MTNHVVIMAGGVGSRLYPLSTPEKPKQFLDLLGCGKALIRLTYERFLAADPDAVFWVVTSAEYVHFVREIVPEIPESQILAEPAARNTAPCIALACWKIKAGWPDANIVVTPADAYVPDAQAFGTSIRTALAFTAVGGAIVCLGINPSSPHTGYGYIHAPAEPGKVVKVLEFKEKPSLEVAERYLAEGGYWWNAGIFVWNVKTIEKELRAHAPQICGIMDELSQAFGTAGEAEATARLFPRCEKISIDYAVMEKSSEVHVLAADWEWSDLGSFEAIEKITGVDPRKSL
ncbi:MAG: mannose-1-phosphate guanylyltransferase [Bacteroidales bacterium]|nr:mannose-1-phosphate guanylyltransferase [Bacteroidales bacterium]